MKRFLLLALLCGCTVAPAPAPQPPPPPPEPRTTAAAARVVLVSLSVTSTTHAAILTGAGREQTGILANYFHQPGTPAGVVTKGLEAEVKAPTLLDVAHAAGRRVGAISFPHLDAKSPRRTPDWGLFWTSPVVPARLVHLSKRDFRAEWVPPAWGAPPTRHPSFSPVMRTRIEEEIPKEGREQFDLAAYDTTDDHVTNYDAFYVEHAGTETPLDAQHWFSISTRFAGGLFGSWSKLLSFDSDLENVTLYLGSVNRNEGLPASYVQLIDDEAGFWPGMPDEHLDRKTFLEQTDRMSSYLTRVTTVSIQRMPFDLLLAYQPIVDAAEHHLRGVDEPAIAVAIADADRAVAAMSNALDPARDALLVVGDHGVAKSDTDVRLNRILKNAGFGPRWTAYSSGNVAMLARGEEPNDNAAVIEFLRNLTAPDGAKVIEQVTYDATRDDITAYAFPRFQLVSKDGEPFVPTEVPGQHGGLTTTHRDYDTVLIAWGRGVAHETLATLPQTEIAGYVLRLLQLK